MTTLILDTLNSFNIPSIGRMSLEAPASLSNGILDRKSMMNLTPKMYLLAIYFGS
jgi:hypothetical protein